MSAPFFLVCRTCSTAGAPGSEHKNEGAPPFPLQREGSIEGDVKRKYFTPGGREGVVLWHPALVDIGRVAVAAGGGSSSLRVIVPVRPLSAAAATWVVMANHGSIGDSFAVANGAMALLGCPREHMVARETWRLAPWPNPPRILTLEPERAARTTTRKQIRSSCRCALKPHVASDSQRRRALLSSKCVR